MLNNVRLSMDVNRAIDQIAKGLGIAANEILPHYEKLLFFQGIFNVLGGLLFATLPYLLFVLYPIQFQGSLIFVIIRLCFCLTMSIIGFMRIFKWAENIFAPRAEAISTLIQDIGYLIK